MSTPFYPTKPVVFRDDPSQQLECTGLGLLEYFAAHAPAEIPVWFEGVAPDFEGEEDPRGSEAYEALSDVDISEISNWLQDDFLDLPAHLSWFENQLIQHRQDCKDHAKDCQIERYFQWRKYYAEQMLEVLS